MCKRNHALIRRNGQGVDRERKSVYTSGKGVKGRCNLRTASGKLCQHYHVPLIINDNVNIAMACHADGIHVGQEDMEAGDVRRLVGEGMILGVSVHTVDEAKRAVACGADYLGVGAVFSTTTKTNVSRMPIETLQSICNAVDVPVVAIGGMNQGNIMELAGSGVDGVALVSAIFSAENIEERCRKLRGTAKEMVKRFKRTEPKT